MQGLFFTKKILYKWYYLLYIVYKGFSMSQTIVNFRIDTEDKISLEQLCDNLGLSLSTAFKIFAKKMIREQRIPFDVSLDNFYSENNLKYLERVITDIESGSANLAEHQLIEDF